MVKKLKSVVTLLGKSGCGKDTQGDILVSEHGFEMINSGVILRNLKKVLPKLRRGSVERYEAETIQKIINAGLFVPTLTIVCQWRIPILELARDARKAKGIVFTGSPRKLAEAYLIHEFFKNWPDASKNFKLCPIEIKLSDKEVFRRLSQRRQCAKCGKIFTAFPEHSALKACDNCAGELIRRKDDTKEGIASRMKEYREYVVPVIDYFKKEELLKSVNGEQSIENVHKDIARAIGM